MKLYKFYSVPFLALVSLVVLLTGCEINEPTEGLEVRLNTYTRETLVSGYIYDANTLQPIEESLTITFVGTNASKIVDETNELTSEFNSKKGIFVFGIEDGTQFSPESPFKVRVVIDGETYQSENEIVVLRDQGYHTKNFYLVDPANLPGNSDSETFDAGSTDNSGTLTQNVQYTTSKGTSISISSGTTLKDKNGNPVTGKLSSTVTLIPLSTGNQYNAPQTISTSDNETVTPVMKFDFIVTDESGNNVDDFSQSVDFSIPIPDDLEVPVGETIYVWKENTSTGEWEKVGEASASAYSSLSKSFTKITSGSLNGSTNSGGDLLFGIPEETCNASLEITNIPENFNSTFQFFDENGTLLSTGSSATVEFEIPTSGLTIKSIRINSELADPFNTGIEIGSNVNLGCGTNSTSLSFPSDLINVQIQILGICTAKDPVVVVNPNITFSYRKEGTSTWQNGSLVNGLATVTGLETGNYEVTAVYQDRTGNARFQIINPDDINILEVSNPENLLSADVDTTTEPSTLLMEIDIEDECN